MLTCATHAQVIYPSNVTTTLTPPYSIYLDEYSNPLTPKIKANIVFTDFTEASWDVYLKLKITGSNFTIESKPGIKPPQPVNVIPGVPFQLSGADLDWYFNNNNLIFSGITRAKLESTNNRLPEGFYTFCFEVVDYVTDRKISLPNCVSAYLSLNDPPLVIAPVCGNAIENTTQQNILFQWQISNTNGSLNVSTLNYQIDLYEVNNPDVNPLTAITNNQALPIWQSQPITQNSYLYGPADPPLEKGKRYAFTVRTLEDGKSQVKNNGYSQPCWFYYGYPEGGKIELITLTNNYQLTSTDNGYFSWKRPDNVINQTQMVGYQFRIVPMNDGQDAETAILNNKPFFETTVSPTTNDPADFALPTEDMMRMERMKTYAWQIKATSGTQEIAKSEVYKFRGTPLLEKFIAGGFEVKITSLTAYDSVANKITGKGKVILNEEGQAPEFSFKDITINPIGNNTWVMSNGEIKDQIVVNPYTLTPDSIPANKNASYVVDSIYITKQNLFLGGFASWKFPLGVMGNSIPFVNAKRQYLILDSKFKLYSQDLNTLQENYQVRLLEPGGFSMQLTENSEVYIKESKYNLKLNGFVELPEMVKDGANSSVMVPFTETPQLFFIQQKDEQNAEAIRLIKNTAMDLKPVDYVFDFSEKTSPGDFSADASWKGLYMFKGGVVVPVKAESTGQISASGILTEVVLNTPEDSTKMFVDQNGLTFETTMDYNPIKDTLKFNTFPAVHNKFKISIVKNNVNQSHLTGKIQIPVLDTADAFPYFIKLDEFGFGTGYLINGLNNYSFTFNPAGGEEQKINMTLTRAVFKNNNRLEMDMNLTWPHFSLSLNQLEKFCAWGNGNIGFETPNGILPLTYQATAKASEYEIQVERVGCGRAANVYSFGVSSRIVMADDISGETGAPVINSYSMYKNPLLSGDFTKMDFSMGEDSVKKDSSGVSADVADNMITNIGQTLSDLNLNTPDSGTNGDLTNTSNNSGNVIISNSVYVDMQKILSMAEIFVEFVDEKDQQKMKDYITVIKQILNSDAVKKLVNTSPDQLANVILQEAADALVRKINEPILKISNKATAKIRSTINDKAVTPVVSKIDTLLAKAIDKIKEEIVSAIDNEKAKEAVVFVVNSAKTNLLNEINNAIRNSVEKNVTSKITGFIEGGVTSQVTGFVRKEVKTIATNIIEKGAANSINLNNIVNHAGELFQDVGDTIVDAIQKINFNTIKSTTENIANDIVEGIDFKRVGENILTDCANKGLSEAIKGLAGKIGGPAGDVVGSVLGSVKFDCSNIGSKIKNGQIDQIVKFDAVVICIKTKAADVDGKLKFTKDDPIYGNSFQADVTVKIKVPKEDKPITGSMKFINGKTTQGDKFEYWFFGGKLLGVNMPLGSLPFTIDGFEGMVYHKMKNIGNPQPLPDMSVNYGVRAGIYLFDTPSKGKIIRFDVGLGVEFGDNFAIQLDGKGDIGNTKSFSVATATGYLGYYSADKRFQGAFAVKFNTAPLLCAGGEMGVKVDGINHTWEVYIGKKATPVEAKILCKDNLKSGGYFDMQNTGIEAGFFLVVDVEAETPWIGGDELKVKGWANFGFGIDAYTNISFEPSFKINDAYISAWANAGIGFDYKTPVKSGSVTIAGVSLSGSLLYKNHERSEIHGAMDGSVTILNCDFGVNMELHYDLDRKQKI